MKIEKTELGFEVRTKKYFCFFGARDAQFENLKMSYKDLNFIRVKQVHGENIVDSSDVSLDYKVEADAHFTKRQNLALCIATADCLPIFLHHEKTGFVAAVHAGWRGVASKLLIKTISRMNEMGASTSEIDILIGPHIMRNSFQVEDDVRKQILSSIENVSPMDMGIYCRQITDDKFLIDLNQVTMNQLEQIGIDHDRVFNLYIDTFKDESFHSFRRDRKNAGRQISFIAIPPLN